MKKTILPFLVGIVLFLMTLSSCGSTNSYAYVSSDYLYAKGTQTITVTSDNEGKFSKSITTAKLSLTAQMDGKTIDEVSFIDEKNITITISGSLTTVDKSTDYSFYQINLLKGSLGGSDTGSVTVRCYSSSPQISSTSYAAFGSASNKTVSSTYSLPYGTFIESNCTSENIFLPDDDGTITTISVTDNQLFIRITGYAETSEYEYPVIQISAKCTSFNIDIYVYVGTISVWNLVK